MVLLRLITCLIWSNNLKIKYKHDTKHIHYIILYKRYNVKFA